MNPTSHGRRDCSDLHCIALSSFTCGGSDTKKQLLPITQTTTTTLVQAPAHNNHAVIHSNSSFCEVYIISHSLRVRASVTLHMNELWLALLIYLCQDTGEGEILTHQRIKTAAKEVSKDVSLPNSQ